jgi:protein TonB
MSYAQRKELTGNKTASIVMTTLVVGGLMYAIVTGLAYNVIKKAVENTKVVTVEDQPPPPPDEPPPPPKDMPKVPPPPMTPPPLVQTKTQPPPIQTVAAPPELPPMRPPVMAPPAPPPPPAPAHKVQSAQSSKGDLRNLFSGDDYPAAAMSAGAEGTAQASITVGPDGRVVGCNITRSSGNGALDAATCNIIRRRAKFTPARDSNGNPTTDTLSTPPITWRLEG